MRLLAILWAEPPTAEDWARLSAARIAIGYTEMVKPVQALQGSPGTLLVIGKVHTIEADVSRSIRHVLVVEKLEVF